MNKPTTSVIAYNSLYYINLLVDNRTLIPYIQNIFRIESTHPMEEGMLKGTTIQKLVSLVLLLVVLGMSSLGARVVASETLTIHAYIPQKTSVAVDAMGQVHFSSNVPSAQVAVAYLQDATLLSVTAL
jgi:hypothetical protein